MSWNLVQQKNLFFYLQNFNSHSKNFLKYKQVFNLPIQPRGRGRGKKSESMKTKFEQRTNKKTSSNSIHTKNYCSVKCTSIKLKFKNKKEFHFFQKNKLYQRLFLLMPKAFFFFFFYFSPVSFSRRTFPHFL